MKPFAITFLLIITSVFTNAYTWIPFGPDSIHASQCRFGITLGLGVICSPYGLCIYENDLEWHHYATGLPVSDAAYKSPTEILVAMGNGSYSDGIYTFDLETHEFEIAVWLLNPNFIHIIPVLKKESGKFTDQYFAGGQFSGLISSVDGETWWEISYFSGKSCTAMDYYNEHFVISEMSNIFNIYTSGDYGVNWTPSGSGVPVISDMKFNNEGTLYGIFSGFSNSSGLWRSDDFGQTWEVSFWSDNMSAVGFDVMNNIFTGWDSPTLINEGVAIYNPVSPPPQPDLTYLNDGLPNLNINRIQYNPTMSAIAIFVCTDQGVYMSYDYLAGRNQYPAEPNEVSIFPNPVSSQAEIRINLKETFGPDITISVLNNRGQKVDEINVDGVSNKQQNINWNRGQLPAGIFYLLLESEKEQISKKFIIF